MIGWSFPVVGSFLLWLLWVIRRLDIQLSTAFFGWSPSPVMTVLNPNNTSAHLGFKSCVTLRRLHRKGQLDDYRRVGPDKRAIYLETDPYGLPSLREHVQKHTACRFDSPLWQAPSWSEVANGYLDLTQWGPPPWTELQWVTLRNVIELAEER